MKMISLDSLWNCKTCFHYRNGKCNTWCDHLESYRPNYSKLEIINAEPVRHGHNENQKYHEVDEFRCSECGLHLEDWTRYVYDEDSDEKYAQEYVFKRCPECGAKIGVQ